MSDSIIKSAKSPETNWEIFKYNLAGILAPLLPLVAAVAKGCSYTFQAFGLLVFFLLATGSVYSITHLLTTPALIYLIPSLAVAAALMVMLVSLSMEGKELFQKSHSLLVEIFLSDEYVETYQNDLELEDSKTNILKKYFARIPQLVTALCKGAAMTLGFIGNGLFLFAIINSHSLFALSGVAGVFTLTFGLIFGAAAFLVCFGKEGHEYYMLASGQKALRYLGRKKEANDKKLKDATRNSRPLILDRNKTFYPLLGALILTTLSLAAFSMLSSLLLHWSWIYITSLAVLSGIAATIAIIFAITKRIRDTGEKLSDQEEEAIEQSHRNARARSFLKILWSIPTLAALAKGFGYTFGALGLYAFMTHGMTTSALGATASIVTDPLFPLIFCIGFIMVSYISFSMEGRGAYKTYFRTLTVYFGVDAVEEEVNGKADVSDPQWYHYLASFLMRGMSYIAPACAAFIKGSAAAIGTIGILVLVTGTSGAVPVWIVGVGLLAGFSLMSISLAKEGVAAWKSANKTADKLIEIKTNKDHQTNFSSSYGAANIEMRTLSPKDRKGKVNFDLIHPCMEDAKKEGIVKDSRLRNRLEKKGYSDDPKLMGTPEKNGYIQDDSYDTPGPFSPDEDLKKPLIESSKEGSINNDSSKTTQPPQQLFYSFR